jgi:hypothetical protein
MLTALAAGTAGAFATVRLERLVGVTVAVVPVTLSRLGPEGGAAGQSSPTRATG